MCRLPIDISCLLTFCTKIKLYFCILLPLTGFVNRHNVQNFPRIFV
nr:MAG TPA: hypothetical protein [Caudoviricetes sp.]